MLRPVSLEAAVALAAHDALATLHPDRVSIAPTTAALTLMLALLGGQPPVMLPASDVVATR